MIADRDDGGTARQRRALVMLLERVLEADRFGRLVESRPDDVVAIISSPATPGTMVLDALRGEAATMLCDWLGTGRIGIGLDVHTLHELPRAYAEARVAVDLVGPFPSIRHLREIDVHTYFTQTADDTARRLLPTLPAEVTSEPLAETLAAFAEANLNVKECVRRLNVHTNMIYLRLNRVQTLTGLDPRNFAALTPLVTAMKLRDVSAGATVR